MRCDRSRGILPLLLHRLERVIRSASLKELDPPLHGTPVGRVWKNSLQIGRIQRPEVQLDRRFGKIPERAGREELPFPVSVPANLTARLTVVVRNQNLTVLSSSRPRRCCRPAGARDRCRPCSCSASPPDRTPPVCLAARSCEVHHPDCSSRIFRRTTSLPIRRRSFRRARCWTENFRRWLRARSRQASTYSSTHLLYLASCVRRYA